MTSIVNQLSVWITNNATKLRDKGVEVAENIPGSGSNIPWKASIGLAYGGFAVSYTVWERTIFQTELLVIDVLNKKTIVMEDREPATAEIVHVDLDDVARKLLDKAFG
jgi:hypothetical protein